MIVISEHFSSLYSFAVIFDIPEPENRVQGRDWYDFVWYVSRNIKLNTGHLEARMRQSRHYEDAEPLTASKAHALLREKIFTLDVKAAIRDIVSFLGDPDQTTVWSRAFFETVTQKMLTETP